jgi:hypothetical protein
MKVLGLIVLVIIAYLSWRFVIRGDALGLVEPNTGDRVSAVVKQINPGKELVIEVTNNNKEHRITEISMLRSLASQLDVSEPTGFKVEALPLTEEDKKNKEMVEFVKEYNKENLRWVGSYKLAPISKTELAIPATVTSLPPSGNIDFQYEGKVGFGGSISFFRVSLDSQEPNKANLADAKSRAAD